LRLFSFGGYGLAFAALALEVFGTYDSYPSEGRHSKHLIVAVVKPAPSPARQAADMTASEAI